MNLLFAAATAAIDKVLDLKFGINTLYSLAVFIPGLALAVRRLHDIGKTGWLLLIVYLAIIACAVSLVVTGIATIGGSFSAVMGVGIILPVIIILALAIWMLVLFCTNGDKGENKYG